MAQNMEFEADYQKRILHIHFTQPTVLASRRDVLQLRAQWTDALKSWHSPYRAIVNCENLSVEKNSEVENALATMMAFLKGFFLKKAEGFGYSTAQGHDSLPFSVHISREECEGAQKKTAKDTQDFRSRLALENHFRQQTVELMIEHPTAIETKKQLNILKSKLTNNLMQWHSGWNLMIYCQHLTINPELFDEWEKMVAFLKGFFLRDIIGYSPSSREASYPFEVFRSRHRAAARLEQESLSSGDTAHCQSGKPL
ncbi:MAG: hypothetical protein AB8C84_02595 [Oligoflexales bacterium]